MPCLTLRLCLSFLAGVLVSAMATAAEPAPAAGAPAVQSANILDIKDASSEPGYASQDNAQRAQVQPGNNAPMWRQVGQGVTGYSSLPQSQAPEAGNLIQPFVQYPGSRVTNAGEAWRQTRNDIIIQTLQNELMVPCRSWNPTRFLQVSVPSAKTPDVESMSAQFSVAVGTAVSSF